MLSQGIYEYTKQVPIHKFWKNNGKKIERNHEINGYFITKYRSEQTMLIVLPRQN
jgi:hypothetical protein